MSHDVIGDFLTIIRNGLKASKPFVLAPHSRLKEEIARVLKEEGFIYDFVVLEETAPKKFLKLVLKYKNGESVIHDIQRVSTPGRRSYKGSQRIKVVIGGLGLSILTTHQGVMSHKNAKKLKVGGEVICTVW